MQTFLPYEDFRLSAKVLDNKRLGKQRVEVLQILRALDNPNYGWQNHPAVKMWRGEENYLLCYGLYICDEWIKRGYKDTCFNKILSLDTPEKREKWRPPLWLGNEDFHRSHQSNLIRKFPEHYRPIFGSDVPDNLPYVWPVKD